MNLKMLFEWHSKTYISLLTTVAPVQIGKYYTEWM